VTGLDLYLDPTMIDAGAAEHVRAVLRNALVALEKAGSAAAFRRQQLTTIETRPTVRC